MTTPPTLSEKQETLYRFPYSHTALELVPDNRDLFRVRLCWLRGKGIRAVFETTAFRPIAEVTLRGQTFPVYLNQHSRKKRDRIVLAGRRKTATASRAALRFLVFIEGREDTLAWTWRVGATAPALAATPLTDTPDTIRLRLPFLPGQPQVFSLALGLEERALAVWSKELVATLVSKTEGVSPEVRENAIELVHTHAQLGGEGATLGWETRLALAKTEADVHQALRAHAALVADTRQRRAETHEPFLWELSTQAALGLMEEGRVRKRGVDRLSYCLDENRTAAGEGTDAALAATALLGRYYLTGDDALRRRARLLGRGVCDYQVTSEESPHWGAIWDVHWQERRFEDIHGQPTVSTAATARAATGLHILHAHFQTELLSRTAIGAAQWLLLRMDKDGFLQGERFHEGGEALPHVSPWAVGEALIPLVETFRRTNNETFLRAALRSVANIEEGMELATLAPDVASTQQLAALVEGVLMVSREYESERMIALAKEVATLLRTRRRPDGSLGDPLHPDENLLATLAGAQAAIALSRVDKDHRWLLLALRALRAAKSLAGDELNALPVATLTRLTQLPLALLLAVGALGSHCSADREKLAVLRQWQTFAPEPAAWEYLQVTTPEGEPVDYLPLVCPTTLQVLIPVIAPPGTKLLKIVKNQREPMMRNLLNGTLDTRAELIPLGDGSEAMIGVFLADT
ncbi:hypothetical protein [Armatimonas rosea]|uniref:Uncharacterized protein n=1 Tax=Armatimonas rosea TaxID=685828 RepID=A0A7W9SNV1_ARMRO|nr:hypothetical protein [Armatimonas rosea]MBB6049304.1 hypothetical protein [Armatimonas rosea]